MTEQPTSPDRSHASSKQVAAQIRCASMVRHAREHILAVGVDRFSLNEVLRLSGGSKATLAKYFGDRTGLIAAAIAEEAREWVASLALQTGPASPKLLHETLQYLLEGVLAFYAQPSAIALYRAVISASAESGDTGQGFYEGGHAVIVDAIAAVIEAAKPAEVRPQIDSRDVADMLLHTIRAGVYEQALLGIVALPLGTDLISARVQKALAITLPSITFNR